MDEPKQIEILRVGTFTANNGTTYSFDIDDLNEIANTYNPDYFKAPLIISHNTHGKDDASLAKSHLAYGFPSRLKVVGDRLKAVFDKVAPQFTQWVRDNQLLSVSASLYTPDSSANPYPGKWALRHIAGLGKEPPAIKGMAALSLHEFLDNPQTAIAFDEFNTPDDGAIDFDSAEFAMHDQQIGVLLQKLREFLIEKHDRETADQTIPSEMVQFYLQSNSKENELLESLYMRVSALEDVVNDDLDSHDYHEVNFMAMNRLSKLMKGKGIDAAAGAKASGISEEKIKSYMEGGAMSPADRKKLAKALEVEESDLMEDMEDDEKDKEKDMEMSELRAQLEEYRQAKEAAEAQLKKAEIKSFCESLSEQITPAMLNAREVEFGESKEEIGLIDFMVSLDDKGLAFMKTHLSALPKQVSFGEFARSSNPSPQNVQNVPEELKDRIELDKRIRERMKERNVSYTEAHASIATEITMEV